MFSFLIDKYFISYREKWLVHTTWYSALNIISISSCEWQVIFPALDIRVKNVARTYSLEHEGEGVLFDHLFALLDSDMQSEESYRRELASCTGALQTSISQHMSKEEEQVSLWILPYSYFGLRGHMICLVFYEINYFIDVKRENPLAVDHMDIIITWYDSCMLLNLFHFIWASYYLGVKGCFLWLWSIQILLKYNELLIIMIYSKINL